MWKALHKQLRQDLRQGPSASSAVSSAASAPAQPAATVRGQPAPPEAPASWSDPAPAAALSDDLLARLARLREGQPRFHGRLQRLDAGQLAAVFADEPAVLVRAPVGSGKTTVLVHRLLHLHLVQGVPLQRIALLTFTHRAAAELRQRIVEILDAPLPRGALWLTGTFHGVACTLLRRVLPIARRGLGPDFSILDEDAVDALLAELVAAHRLRVGRRHTLRQRLRSLGPGQTEPADLQRLGTLFTEAKRLRNALDFDDLIDFVVELSQAESAPNAIDAAPGPQAPDWRPQAVLVDEMQDCEERELALLKALRGPATRFFAVGDPYQAIYGFRGSAPQIFARAEADFACRTYALPCNYRSTRTIVDGARAVLGMQPAAGSAPGGLRAVRGAGERIVVRRHHDPIAEAIYLAERIARLAAAGVPLSQIAVLFRLRAQAAPVREALMARGLPCIEHDESLPAPDDGAPGDSDPPDRTDSDHQDHATAGAEPTEAVRLSTLHAAKGLEWRVVFLSGVNQGLLPLGRGFHLDVAHDAEERCLLFVGITRARDCVEISYHARPHEPLAVGDPSDFLAALPADVVDWQQDSAAPQPVPAQPKKDADATSRISAPAVAPPPMPDPAVATATAMPAIDAAVSLHVPPPTAVPSVSRAAAPATDAAAGWQPGQAVRHPRYGTGVVLAVSADTVDCRFGKLGERSFPLALCPLTRVDEPSGKPAAR